MVCDVPYVGKRWVHQVARYDTDHGISYWTENYRTALEADDELALGREHPYYDPICMLPEPGRAWWRAQRARPSRGPRRSSGWLVATAQLVKTPSDRGPFGRGDAEPGRVTGLAVGAQPVGAQDALETRADPVHRVA